MSKNEKSSIFSIFKRNKKSEKENTKKLSRRERKKEKLTNPIYDIAKEADSEKKEEDPLKKRLEDIASVSALTNVIKAVGRGMSISAGAKASKINTDVFDSSVKYLDKLREIEEKEEQAKKAIETRTALQALRPASENNALYEKELKSYNDYSKKQKAELEKRRKAAAEEEKRRLAELEKSSIRNRNTLSNWINEEKRKEQKALEESKKNQPKVVANIRYEGENVAIHEDEMTDIYRLANYDNMLYSYHKERDAKGRAYQLAAVISRIFDKYGKDEVLNGTAVQTINDTRVTNPISPFLGKSSK